jgi:trehalose/maltose hydrolase-like predicted phosphorylase
MQGGGMGKMPMRGDGVMWDIETFSVPPLILLQPEAARALLEFRFRHLGGARRCGSLAGACASQHGRNL